MLLSTDWFAPYWTVIGLEPISKNSAFKMDVGTSCDNFVGRARDYYLIDFSDDRVGRTGLTFARSFGIANSVMRLQFGLRNWWQTSRAETNSARQFGCSAICTTNCLKTRDLDQQIKSALARSHSKLSFASELNFEEICLRSSTAWDGYIRNLTPELPASLAHLVSVVASLSKGEWWDCAAARSRLRDKQRLPNSASSTSDCSL